MGLLDSLNPISAAGNAIGSIYGIFTGISQRKAAKEAAKKAEAAYGQSLDFANQGLDSAKGMQTLANSNYGGRMAGAGAYENSIYGNQANTLAAAARNSTSAAQQLALAGAVQGNTNDAFGNLALMEAQDKQRRYGDLFNANQGLNAGLGNLQNLYGNRSNQLQQNANQLGTASQQNIYNGINGLANTAAAAFGGGNKRTLAMPDFNNASYYQQAPRLNYRLPGLQNSLNDWG